MQKKVEPRDFIKVRHFLLFQTAVGKYSGRIFFFHPFKKLKEKNFIQRMFK